MAAGLRCGSSTIKYLLFFFNFLFTLFGLAIVALGAVGLSKTLKHGDTLNNSLVFITVVGAFIFVVAFFGCCGAVRESHCMLVTFACLLLTIIVCEVIAGILIFVSIGGVDKTVDEVFNGAKDGKQDYKEVVDGVQQTLKCCGLKDPSFWGGSLPPSCCDNQPATCSSSSSYQTGCKTLISDTISQFGKALGAVAIAIAVIEIIGVWFSLALAGEIKKLSRQ